VSILPLGGFFARRTYPGLILYVNSRCVSVVVRIDAVNLRNLVNKHLHQLQASSIYLGVLCVHEGLSKTEQDEVDVRHETVSSHGRRVNLNKMSDLVTDRVCQGIAVPASLFSSN
jgi:hypothetical protein